MPNRPNLEQDFEQIVRDNQALVFRTLARLVGRSHPLEDLAQEVFLRLYRALPGFRGEALIGTYLYRIAVNVAQNEWKRLRREDRRHISLTDEDSPWADRLAHPAANAAQQMEQHEFALALEQHLARLSELERSTLILYHQEERTYEQIAAILSLPINTVRTHLHRGRNKLRLALAPGAQLKPASAGKAAATTRSNPAGVLHAR